MAVESERPAALALEDFLPSLPAASPAEQSAKGPAPAPAPPPALRTARLVSVEGQHCTIAWRGSATTLEAELAPEVDRDLVAHALRQRDAVLVEHVPGAAPLVVGVVQTQLPRELHLKAATIHVEAEDELLLRAGHAGLRLRRSGEVEIVGSRISAASRGLFRIVGRILRLN